MAYHFLLSLFSSPQEADAIEGDLCEERASMAARDGDRAAARWYRQQIVRTVWQLATAPFRSSPLLMLGLGIAFMASAWPLGWLSNRTAQQLVLNVPVYQYIPANLFWQLTVVPPFIVMGFLIASLTGRRAMSVSIAVFLAIATMVCVVDPLLMLAFGPARPQQTSVLFWVTRALYAIATWDMVVLVSTAVGISLVRKFSNRPDRGNARLQA
jgi:hypothetical protein